jgi:hypothetical protein
MQVNIGKTFPPHHLLVCSASFSYRLTVLCTFQQIANRLSISLLRPRTLASPLGLWGGFQRGVLPLNAKPCLLQRAGDKVKNLYALELTFRFSSTIGSKCELVTDTLIAKIPPLITDEN